MSEDKSLFSVAFPTLVGKEPREGKEDATVIQTRGPWVLDENAAIDDSIDEELDLPDLPSSNDVTSHTMPAVAPPAGMRTPGPSAEKAEPLRKTPQPPPSGSYAPARETPSGSQRVQSVPKETPSGSQRVQSVPKETPSGGYRSVQPAPRDLPSGSHRPSRAPEPEPPVGDDSFFGHAAPSTDILRGGVAGSDKKIIGGKYEVEARIGEGGMGRVYRVRHVDLGKTFALKIMRSVMADDEKMRQAFFREARLASSLSHPQIVSIVDFGQDPKFGVFMVMELLDGEPLKKMLKERGRFNLRAACDIMLQVADAVRYVHEKGIVHCDLKAENILVTTERSEHGRRAYRVKLLDFGLARQHTGPDRSATLSGTPAYIAPERIRGAHPAPGMDIYALGVLFYEMLAGQPPFTGSLETVLYHHVNEPVPSPSVVLQKAGGEPLDEAVEALILKSLAKNPEDRQQSVGAFMYELRTAMEMLGFATRRRTRSKPSPRTASNDLVGGLFAECPLPLAVFSSEASILIGNKAFSVFVCGEAVDLRGVALSDTSLLRACPTLRHDIRTVLAEGRTVQVGLMTPGSNGAPTQLLLWLTPGPPDTEHVYCAIHVVGRI